jgi:hypothetical protein
MEQILIAALGIGVLFLALSWSTTWFARYRLRRKLSGFGILLLIALMAIAYSKYGK